MKTLTLHIFLIFSVFLYSQEYKSSIYDNLKIFSTKTKDSLNINEITVKYDTGNFYKEESQKIYKKLDDNTYWLHFKLKADSKNTYQYFTINNPYLSYGKVYLRKNNIIKELHRVSYYKEQPYKFIFYRLPTWKITSDELKNNDVFIELKNNGGRSRLELFLEDENTFLQRTQIEYIQFGLFIAFLCSMIIILLYFSILKKEYSVIFYALYILTALIEFIAGKGLGIQFFWSESTFLSHSIRSLSQTLGMFFIGLFYFYFYKLKTNQKITKNIFKWGVYITIPLLCVYLFKAFFGGLNNFYLYVWGILKVIAIVWFCTHLYLIKKKQIPLYLVLAFILPIIAIVTHQNINPSVYTANWLNNCITNLYYITLSFEILLFTRYIFGSVIKTQQKYFDLKKISNELQYNFQNKTLEIQQEERNKLVSNVHDTFGGYLEALKLRLLQKSENTPEKIEEILNAFYKDYRYLLNSLYAPKINADNFVENLIEFCDKLNQLIDSNINHHFSLNESQLSQEKCIHLYRIISELVTNAIKHSNASKIEIRIQQQEKNVITVEVSDNGIGFDKNTVYQNGFGLKNIKQRVKEINGQLKMDSNNLGTKFIITTSNND